MAQEAADAGAAVARMLAANADRLAALGERLRAAPPPVVVTCARGSSDHAASYGKYLIELATGIPVASAAPSVASVFGAPVRAAGALAIAVSQSGRSPDLLAAATALREGGAHLVALVNDAASPLAELADTVITLEAGPERSVAATKSCIAAMAAFTALVAAWSGDVALTEALGRLPARLDEAWALDWSAASAAIGTRRDLYVVGRGPGFGVAQEAALKLKETCALHAEAFSAAELRHGPVAIVDAGFPVIAFASSDAAGKGVRALAGDLAAMGAAVALADPRGAAALPALADHPLLEPVLMLQSFYRMAEGLARARGFDPDRPRGLSKVTQTV